MSRSKRFKIGFFTFIGILIVLAVFIAAGFVFQSEASIPPERISEITRGDVAMAVVATGAVVPIATVEVKSKASGLVNKLFVEEGDIVREGEILAELDKELLRAQVREAEANLQAVSSRHQQAESEAISSGSMKQKLEMDLQNLESKVDFHKRQIKRYEALFAENLIPHSELEQREREYQDANFAAGALRSELLMQDARIEAAEKAVATVAAEVLQAQALLDRARENLRYSTIVSPITGTVLKRHVEVGDAVSSILQLGSQATLMITLGDMNTVFFEGRVDETDIGKVFVGQRTRVKVDAYRDRPFPGEVVRIAPLGEKVDNVIGFEVRVAITDSDRILRAQMSANAEIIVEEKKGVLVIPEAAIIYDSDRNTFANLYDSSVEEKKRRVAIEVGISDGTSTELVSGVEEGNQVVKEKAGGLID